MDSAGEARMCIAGTQSSQSDDSSVHFRVMPVLTDRESRFGMLFSVHVGRDKGKSASVVKTLFPLCPGYFRTTVSLLPHLAV